MTEVEAFTFLGIIPGAAPAAVRRAYLRLAREMHPDLGGDAAAFAVLGDAYRLALAASYAWPCEACRGTGRKAISGHGFGGTTMLCGACAGSGKSGDWMKIPIYKPSER